MSKVDNNQNDQVSRRSFLKMLGIGGAGVVIGASGAGSIFHLNRCSIHQRMKIKDAFEFYGRVQAGITTPTQKL